MTPQGVVAVCRRLDVPLADVLDRSPRLLALCADVRDPGNAGTVIRCADAAGAGGVAFLGNSVDPYNGKAVRASAGSLFHLPLALERGRRVGTRARPGARASPSWPPTGAGETDLDEAEDRGLLAGPTAWLFGNEAWGLPRRPRRWPTTGCASPSTARAESLNLATAAAVCLYASARAQRAAASRPAVTRSRPGAPPS